MDGEAHCVGCGKRGTDVCADCRKLAVGDRSLRATRVPLGLALGLFGACLLGFFVALPAGTGALGSRTVGLAAILLSVTVGWAAVELRRPIRLGMTDDALTVGYVLGARRRIPLSSLRLLPGAISDEESGVRYRAGEDRFPGAAEFHRVLRIRLALYRPTDFIASSG